MELTFENAVEIAKKYNFCYNKDLLEIVIPNNIFIDDDDLTFMHIKYNGEVICAYKFGLTTQENGKFGYHTTEIKIITTTEEFEEIIKNFLSFVELTKQIEKKYAEQIKLNKMDKDF